MITGAPNPQPPEDAVRDFNMISKREMTIRKVVGSACVAYAGYSYLFTTLYFATTLMIAIAGVDLYNTGKWNIDGRGPSVVPSAYRSFVSAKQKEVLYDGIKIVVLGDIAGIALAFLDGTLSQILVLDIITYSIGLTVGAVALSMVT